MHCANLRTHGASCRLGYSVATTEEQNAMRAAGDPVKRDQKRSRRLEEGEQQRIEMVLAGGLLIEAQRPMRPGTELGMMFQLIVETGMRLRECYTLTRGRVLLDMGENVLDLAGTKGHRGAVKPRQVPLRPRLRRLITEWLGKLPPDRGSGSFQTPGVDHLRMRILRVPLRHSAPNSRTCSGMPSALTCMSTIFGTRPPAGGFC